MRLIKCSSNGRTFCHRVLSINQLESQRNGGNSLKLSLYDYMFSRRSLVTYICHPGILGSLWFSFVAQTPNWYESNPSDELLRSAPDFSSQLSQHELSLDIDTDKQIEFQFMSMFLMSPIFLKLLKHKKTFQSWSSQLQINLKSVRNHGWKGSTSWVAKNPQRWNCQPLSWLQETSHIDSI